MSGHQRRVAIHPLDSGWSMVAQVETVDGWRPYSSVEGRSSGPPTDPTRQVRELLGRTPNTADDTPPDPLDEEPAHFSRDVGELICWVREDGVRLRVEKPDGTSATFDDSMLTAWLLLQRNVLP